MTSELWSFVLSGLCGVAAVVLWYFFSALKKYMKGRAFECILDILWWLVSTSAFLVCIWHTSSMRLRMFNFISLVLGAFLCRIMLKKPLMKIFSLFFGVFFKIFEFILKILLTPCGFLYKILVVPIMRGLSLKTRKVAKYDSPEGHSS